jgi:hypothetical protein
VWEASIRSDRYPMHPNPEYRTRAGSAYLANSQLALASFHKEITMSANTDRIRALNDQLRRHLLRGRAIAALGREAVPCLIQIIATFEDFCAAAQRA